MSEHEEKNSNRVTTVTFHVLSQKTGEQLFQSSGFETPEDVRRMAIDWASEQVARGCVVTMWRTVHHDAA